MIISQQMKFKQITEKEYYPISSGYRLQAVINYINIYNTRTEVCDIVQEAVIKTIPKKKKCKKAKWLSEEALQIAEKRRESKGKGVKETYSHLNAEFQRTRRDNKAFFSDQCKEIEENNRMGKTRDLFKKEIPKEYFMQRWAQ